MHTLKFADLMLFLSTLSLRRATVLHQTQKRTQPFLSTLSLRRATLFPLLRNLLHHHFYPRSPYGERLKKLSVANGRMEFLSTLSLRRATKPNKHQNLPRRFLSTLSLRRATFEKFEGVIATKISIHALLTESDTWTRGSRITYVISIHALLTESDRLPTALRTPHQNFYPRSPYGERQ